MREAEQVLSLREIQSFSHVKISVKNVEEEEYSCNVQYLQLRCCESENNE